MGEFGLDGKSRRWSGGGSCTIVSTARLPAEKYEIAIGLDRKMQIADELPSLDLTRDEIDLLLKSDDFFKAHLLPED